MGKKWTKTESFAYFKAKCGNTRWSWSGCSEDGKTVVITLWQDRLKARPGGGLIYDDRNWPLGRSADRPGNAERKVNLQHALERCDGRFRVVVAKAQDVAASPRTIADCFPHEKLWMQISEFNQDTGEFVAISVD
jgi:hypothetical protein